MLLNRSLTLASGQRVKLRLPHGSDAHALAALHVRLGRPVDAAAIAAAMRHDPRVRAVVCAVGWTSAGQAVLGVAAGDVGGAGPDVLLVDPDAGAELARVLTAALAERTGPSVTRRDLAA